MDYKENAQFLGKKFVLNKVNKVGLTKLKKEIILGLSIITILLNPSKLYFLFRNDSNIISRGFVAKNDYLGTWNYRSIPELQI